MSDLLQAEVEYVQRSIVTVNIDKLLASDWAIERKEYDTDQDFARGVLRKLGYHDLLDPCSEDEVGIAIEGDYEGGEIRFLGIVPSQKRS